MCNILTGYINPEGWREDFFQVCREFNRPYEIETDDILAPLQREKVVPFRLTKEFCDCCTAIGGGSADEPELAEHIRFFRALQRCPKLRFIEIFNHFYSEQSDRELRAEKEIPLHKTHIDQLTPVMLAELPEDTVLRILLYRKSW